MLHSCQTEKPRNSAKIDGHRLRRATRRPFAAQNDASSGSQSSIHRPRRGASTVPIVSWCSRSATPSGCDPSVMESPIVVPRRLRAAR